MHVPLLRRCCPKCGTRVDWVRLWLKPWPGAVWPCPNCGALLRFDLGRRMLVALLFASVLVLASLAGNFLGPLSGLPPWVVGFGVIILLVVPVSLLDAVTLAGPQVQPGEKAK